MLLAQFSRIGGSGNLTPNLLRRMPDSIPLHHQLRTDNFITKRGRDFQMVRIDDNGGGGGGGGGRGLANDDVI